MKLLQFLLHVKPGCSSEFSGLEMADADLVHIKITSTGLWSLNTADGNIMDTSEQESSIDSLKIPDMDGDGLTFLAAKFWSNWIGSGAKRGKLIFKSWKNEKEFLEPEAESAADRGGSKPVVNGAEISVDVEAPHIGFPLSAKESVRSAVVHFCSKCRILFSSFWRNVKQFFGGFCQLWNTAGWAVLLDMPRSLKTFRLERLDSLIVQWLEKRSKAFEPTYLYTVEKGYFFLPEGAKSRHNIRTVNISIPAQHPCFGNRWQQLLINSFVGYDTILMNSLLSSPGQGYLYNFQTKEFYDLSYAHEPAEGSSRFEDYLVTKCGVLIMSLFVFFTTTMSVSFTLRETQSRMLKFTVQLQHHARYRLPTFQLIFVHVIESLVFVPIMIGILFFLFEFYDDQLLAFMVLILVWLCELFTMISVRTPISKQFFPRFFLLYFLVFHIYFFSYASGFSYVAFATTAAFMHHLILYFWNRFEVPALERYMRSRQLGVHITSSTILTSTLHIARVNMRNPNLANNELGSGSGPSGASEQERPDVVEGVADFSALQEPLAANDQDRIGNPHQFQESDSRPAEATPNTPLNSFNSLLLWILGGPSSDNRVSFFSMFRDMRDPSQDYAESPRQETRPMAQHSWWRRI
ncbi:membralin-like protein At1g60995 isoform X2 [Magnolia sinica]|uniref:membralin-like protein At1g60995 isoform X2 n=1 Tax=Magnolia sinica TaxID=86752 RepID=UPI002659D406|nr:membralin-like protein At1g60995 isoform X2 [Magnolia sinica]